MSTRSFRYSPRAVSVIALVIGLLWCLVPVTAKTQGVFDHPVVAGTAEAQALDGIADQLRGNLPVAGIIEQRKYLAILREPMISTGRFNLTTDGHIHWHIEEPFAVTYAMAEGELTRTMEGKTEVISAASEPSLYGFFQMFSRLFELSLKDLNSYFAVSLLTPEQVPEQTSEQWVIGLTPEDSRLQKLLAHIIVQGREGVINQVTLTEPGDDYTVLNFSYVRDSQAQ
ncbi:outer membrane lipoprotein carrier protein LolA [Gilvimarinus agarilyticus]|uniref:outer membrane lipoprotein carrier protein LolA n=1 Tax=Gilvimarinus agarilyticus TaxID=679259 RepID=UPI0005A0B57E|nr:outer membrane lipoprotein carrier protein LolA [Gilvimarinus agarilyticus]